MGRIAPRFARVEPRRRAREFVLGLLSDLPRKNCWTLAEHAGDATPDGLQHLLSRARWDADAVRDVLRDFVIEQLHNDNAVLVVDETGDLKKGTATVGVQRQYTGTAGRIEHSQVAPRPRASSYVWTPPRSRSIGRRTPVDAGRPHQLLAVGSRRVPHVGDLPHWPATARPTPRPEGRDDAA
ncbi:transposase [Streptomyces sp. NPDC047869]|uniref:IS701 family transposase n=1 Tax=Streptomyces sp. NPDC047869 TaxID=3154709 RepID=UPI00345704AD